MSESNSGTTLIQRSTPPPPSHENEMIPADDIKTLQEAEAKQIFLSEKQLRLHITAIRQAIRSEEARLRKKYKWLAHQNFLGAGCFLISILALILTAYLYLKRYIGFWLTIPMMAIPTSILHELEHDLIHNMYFKGKQWVQNIMFTVIWFTKWHLNPWYRKIIHLRHHAKSGQKEDIEERLIGLGQPLGWLRVLLTCYPISTLLIFPALKRDNADFSRLVISLMTAPTTIPFTIVWHLFFEYCRLFMGWTLPGEWAVYDPTTYLPLWLWPYVRDAAVLIVLPNILRQACLNILASYCHYYGDIPRDNVFYQNQILNHWILYPLQSLAFNFGATHIIHHFVWNQPFYLRQMVAPKATIAMKKHGIRENDFGIVLRNNRYFPLDSGYVEGKKPGEVKEDSSSGDEKEIEETYD